MHALNVAYDLEEERPAWKKFPLSLLYTLLLAALAIARSGSSCSVRSNTLRHHG